MIRAKISQYSLIKQINTLQFPGLPVGLQINIDLDHFVEFGATLLSSRQIPYFFIL